MDLSHAIESHINWRMKFRKAISNHESMDIATISKDNCCELGKWLHAEGKTKYGKLKSYDDCVRKLSSEYPASTQTVTQPFCPSLVITLFVSLE